MAYTPPSPHRRFSVLTPSLIPDLISTQSECSDMSPNSDLLTTSVLLIDGSKNQSTYWAEQLKRCSPEYEIVEASDGQSGLDIYRSRHIDCVVLELSLPDQSGFQTLVDLVPMARRPHVAVIVLTHMTHRGVWELAKQNGAYVCLAKKFTSGDDLDKAIQRAVAFVGQMPKEDRYRPI
jgi:DNA-binding NarL/FixJ family response regulator